MKNLIITLASAIILLACETAEENSQQAAKNNAIDNNWLIPFSQVFDGGPGRDGIPALENPNKTTQGDFLRDPEFVIGYYDGEQAIAYPHQILDWHEIINDELNGFPYAITYCPLTGTGIGWDRAINGATTTFGVSGLLYNNNLIPFDRATNSNWSQMRNDCVNGKLQGDEISTFPVVEMRWQDWKAMYPNTQIVSTNTGHDRQYGAYPYGDYKTNNKSLFFPLSPDDNRLARKERVHGIIIDGNVKVYRFSTFNSSNTVIQDTFQGNDLIVVGNASSSLIVSFYAKLEDGSSPEFTAVNEGSVILADTEGNQWDVFGYATAGPRKGQRLISTKSYMGYWFAWGTFYPQPDIYQ